MPLVKQRHRSAAPKAGDIFSVVMESGRTVYGRVIRTDATVMSAVNGVLLYFYDTNCISVICSNQATKHLIMPPIITARDLWSKGYAVTIANSTITADQRLRMHCFYNDAISMYVDDNEMPCSERHDPCGPSGLILLKGISNLLDIVLSGGTVQEYYNY